MYITRVSNGIEPEGDVILGLLKTASAGPYSKLELLIMNRRRHLSTCVTIRIPIKWADGNLASLSRPPLSDPLQLCTGGCYYRKASHSHQWCIVFVFDILEWWLISLPPVRIGAPPHVVTCWIKYKIMQVEHWLNIDFDSWSNTAKKKTENWRGLYITALAALKIEGCRELLRIHRLALMYPITEPSIDWFNTSCFVVGWDETGRVAADHCVLVQCPNPFWICRQHPAHIDMIFQKYINIMWTSLSKLVLAKWRCTPTKKVNLVAPDSHMS